ncbi:MAG: sodium:proton antiporter [Deltaproteobacteria bacterium]|nr:sodium:proton antiporter [Deltaproteobacteria bacterium]
MEPFALQTITFALVLGVASYILSRWLRVPAIIFYLLAGLIAGPVGLKLVDTDSLGRGLLILVEITVAIILFEGGLSLSSRSFKSESSAIRRMLLVTLPLTGIGSAALAHYLLDMPWQIAVFFGALIVVTGPTVVGSILKSVYLTRRLEIILNWESIWGDVIGVLLSAVALELVDLNLQDSWGNVGLTLFLRIVGGVLLGIVGGYSLTWIINRVCRLRDTTLPGIVSIAGALAIFYTANFVMHSSGPLAVAIAGFILSKLNEETLHEIRHFKEQISSIFISTMFVLLSAYINPMPLLDQWPMLLLTALIMGALVRPFSVAVALWKTPVLPSERVFIGLIGPRGIIAASTAAYAALTVSGYDGDMTLVLNLTYAVIFFSGVSATLLCRPLARFLKVLIPVSRSGLLIVGVNSFSSALADFAGNYVPVSFLETNNTSCILAEHLGHDIICTDLLDSNIYEEAMEDGFGRLLAVTRNDAMNELIAKKAAMHLESNKVYWVAAKSDEESINLVTSFRSNLAFSNDFSLIEAVNQLDHNEAVLKVLKPEEIQKEGVIPLLEILKKGQGLSVVLSGQTVRNDALCYVPSLQCATPGTSS